MYDVYVVRREKVTGPLQIMFIGHGGVIESMTYLWQLRLLEII